MVLVGDDEFTCKGDNCILPAPMECWVILSKYIYLYVHVGKKNMVLNSKTFKLIGFSSYYFSFFPSVRDSKSVGSVLTDSSP